MVYTSENKVVNPLYHLFLAIPAEFIQPLKTMEAKEGETVTLTCEYSLPGVQFHWSKGFEIIRPGDKYVMKQRKTINSLTIKVLKTDDSGDYTCQCRNHRTTASLKVHGMAIAFLYLCILPHVNHPSLSPAPLVTVAMPVELQHHVSQIWSF